MALDVYNRELKRILTDDAPGKKSGMTRQEIETAIAEISKALSGPLHNSERLCLVEDRRNLRKQLETTG